MHDAGNLSFRAKTKDKSYVPISYQLVNKQTLPIYYMQVSRKYMEIIVQQQQYMKDTNFHRKQFQKLINYNN